MVRVINLLLLVCISGIVVLNRPYLAETQQTSPSALLAFTLVRDDPDVWYSKVRIAYLYNPISRELRTIGYADSLQWSPSGRYLALLTTTLPIPTREGGYGVIGGFEIYDMETRQTHYWDYFSGTSLNWLPGERFLIAGGGVSRSGGSNSWIDIFAGDGSGEPPGPHTGYVDGMMGSRGRTEILGLTEDLKLVIREIAAERENYWIIDPETRQRTRVEGDPPFYTVLPARTFTEMFGQIGSATSPDYQFTAITRVDVPPGETTYLMIVEMNSGDTHLVEVPFETDTQVFRMAWRPCPNQYPTDDC